MPKFFNSDMADLAHQLTLSPRRLRVEQIQGIDKLLGLIDPDRAYPFEFVCHAVTKYRKRGGTTGPLIPGMALIGDLTTMADVITRRAGLSVAELGEGYLTHQQLAEQLSVSTKTIRRWRDRGLMSIRVVFEDGVNRLAFLRCTVTRFVERNKDLVEKGGAFKQLTTAERDQIVGRARDLLARRPVKLHTAARIIAEETGRAVETIRYTLRRHDSSRKSQALFSGREDSVLSRRLAAIWSCHEAGETSESIARVFGCSRDEIARILRQIQVQRWKDAPPQSIHNELFDAPNADAIILDVPEPPAGKALSLRIPKDLPPYLRSLYLMPLLTRAQEQDLFRRYNYLKYSAAKALERLDGEEGTAEQFNEVRELMERIQAIRQRIVEANLRLVVSIAKKHVGRSSNLFEVVSDGNVSLMRAVENFDYARGNKFSTYATWAIVKNYARSIPDQHYHGTRYVTGQDAVLDATPDETTAPVFESDRGRVRQVIADGLGELSEREREIVSGHFGLDVPGGGRVTLEQLGRRFGVTKERVRQIEQGALARLREILSPSLVDALAG